MLRNMRQAGLVLLRRYLRWRRYRTTMEKLKQLDEQNLRDLSLSRWDFGAIASGTFTPPDAGSFSGPRAKLATRTLGS